jgi:glyoxylase-like metal-dependent hydrolase (beta-lactamase superfamily II)
MSVAGNWTWTEERAVEELERGLHLLDLGFQGRPQIIAAYLLSGDRDLALIETGPGSTIDRLEAGIRRAGFEIGDLTHLLLTHIHLDHAGAAGLLARSNPRLVVHVHPFGAPHLIDPTKLINSATRIYGEQMGPLWGEIAPIRPGRVIPFEDDQVLYVAGRALRILFTPGHAWHHVALWEPATSAVYTGDVSGIRMPGHNYICPPTPPPDLDPEAWLHSIQRLRDLNARRLCLTHFGPFYDPGYHLDSIATNLTELVDLGERELDKGASQAELTVTLHREIVEDLDSRDPEVLANYEWATPSYMAAMGITRYHSKKTQP